MYDTAAALLGRPPLSVTDPTRWDRTMIQADPRTGEAWPRYIRNVDGLSLTLLPGGQLKAERSLTKALLGTNVLEMTDAQVPDALAVVDEEIGRALDVGGLPPFGTWLPVRVDYATNQRLSGEGEVFRRLEALSLVDLPRKGLPVRGQAHSVTWPVGRIRPKLYGKYLESGDPRALGMLRLEVGVFRAATFRHVLGSKLPATTVKPSDVTLGDVLTPEFAHYALTRFDDRLGGGAMTAREVGDMELVALLRELFGVRHSVTMLGWALMWDVMGARTARDILATGAGSVATRYRIVADFRRLRDEMQKRDLLIDANSKWVDDGGVADEGTSDVIQRVAHIQRAAA